jgi:hypothetical protein
MASRSDSDESYVIDLCDEILGHKATRQHRFDFLRGDPSSKRPRGTKLPVDAYYADLALVIEYRERQHTKPIPHFDKPHVMTVSGCDRGIQRRIYDQRRRDVLRTNGIELLEVECSLLARGSGHKLKRSRSHDLAVLRMLMQQWCPAEGPNKRIEPTA